MEEVKKPDRRTEILNTAAEMFAKDGYANVSMRSIAEAMSISVGNLTYHFKYKEDLIEQVVLQKHQDYKKPIPPKGLVGLHRFFIRMLKNDKENEFWFGPVSESESYSERVLEIRQEVDRDFSAALREGFANLERGGFVVKEEPQGQREQLIGAIRILLAHPDGLRPGERLTMLWALVYPLLTSRGKRSYKNEVMGQRSA